MSLCICTLQLHCGNNKVLIEWQCPFYIWLKFQTLRWMKNVWVAYTREYINRTVIISNILLECGLFTKYFLLLKWIFQLPWNNRLAPEFHEKFTFSHYANVNDAGNFSVVSKCSAQRQTNEDKQTLNIWRKFSVCALNCEFLVFAILRHVCSMS